MTDKQLTESVVKKIQMAKLLFDLGTDCFKISENPEKIGAGIILLQDSIEIFLVAICEQLDVPLSDRVDFDKYFVGLKNKTSEEVPLKRQMLTINKQRVSLKHFGVLPHIDDCRDSPNTVRTFFEELSDRYLKTNFDSITLVDLLKDDEVKELLKQAEIHLKSGEFKECQINCRKALYLVYEKYCDVRPLKNGISTVDAWKKFFQRIYSRYMRDEDVEKYVDCPTDYIQVDHDKLEKDLMLNGIMPMDFWNVLRLTPSMYYYEDDKEWVIKDDFRDDAYNEKNAEYCIRKTVEILLLKQRHSEQTKYIKERGAVIKTKRKEVKVFEKASANSKEIIELGAGQYEIYSSYCVRGLDDKKCYYHVLIKVDEMKYYDGFICEDDVESIIT
ncbi:MAG: hypothetical protein AB1546_16850 [bacterium]